MSNYMNRYGFRAWPLYELGGGGVFKVRPAHLHHKFFEEKLTKYCASE